MKKTRGSAARRIDLGLVAAALLWGSIFLPGCSPSKSSENHTPLVTQTFGENKAKPASRTATLTKRMKQLERRLHSSLAEGVSPLSELSGAESPAQENGEAAASGTLSPAKEAGIIFELTNTLKNHPAVRSRCEAAEDLGRLDDPAAVAALRAALEDPDYQVKLEAAIALVRLQAQADAFPVLAKIARKEDVEQWAVDVEEELARKLEWSPEAREVVRERMQAEWKEKYLPAKALLALAQIDDAASLAVLEERVLDRNAFVRTWTCLLLMDLGREAVAIPVLVDMAKDANLDQRARSEVIGILAKEKKRDILESIQPLTADKDEFIATRAKMALAK